MLLPVASSRAADRWRPILAAGLTGLVCAACAPGAGTAPLGLTDPHAVSEPEPLATSSITQQDLAPPTTPAAKVAVADIEVSAPVAANIRKARDLRTAGKKSEALELLDKSAGADKDRALIGERGLLALELGQIDKSVALLAPAQNPAKPDWRMQSAYGAALSAAGRQKEAQDQFSKALAAAPGQPSTAEGESAELENLSQELLDKLKTVETDEEAAQLEEEILDAWLVSGSATVDTLMERGLEYQGSEDLAGARDAFDRAIAIQPDYAEAWNRRAVLFFNDGKYDEAVADLESAIQLEPRHFGAWMGLAMIFESIDRPAAAMRAYEKALEIHPHLEAAEQGKTRLDRIVNGSPL
jgi:Flp pilus assembly protein TadD